MKIKRLRIKNIASFEEADINFEGPELKAADVFLISGTVGAGKSTILDSIALALYGGTPRLSPDKRGANSNVERILRRNTAVSQVILDFEGNDGTPYVCTWERHRGHNKLDRAYQPVRRVLLAFPGTPREQLFEKGDLQPEIQRAVGLDFSDFCRTTMLAQGDFAAFLKASDEEKSRILEKLTGTVEYTQLGKKIYEMSRAADDAARKAREQAERFTLLTDEQVQAIKEKINAEKANEEAERTAIATAQKHLAWFETEENLIKEADEASRKLETVRARKSASNEQELFLDAWDKSSDLRLQQRNIDNALKQLHEKEQEMGSLRQEVLKFRGVVLTLDSQTKELADQLSAKLSELKPLEEEAQILDNARHYAALIDSVLDARQAFHVSRTELERTKADLTPALQEASAAEQKLERTRKNESDEMQHIADLETKPEYSSLADNIRAENSCKLRAKALRELDSLRTGHKTAMTENERAESEINVAEDKLKARRIALEARRKLLPELKNAAERLEGDWNKAKVSGEEWAGKVRSTLSPGDICPVCLREISDMLPDNDEIYSTILAPVKEAWTNAKNLYISQKDEVEAEDADIQIQDAILAEKKKNVSAARQEEAQQIEKIKKAEAELEIEADTEITFLVHKTELRQAELAAQVKAGENIARELRAHRQNLLELTDARKKAEAAEKAAATRKHDVIQAQTSAVAKLEERQGALTAASARLREEIGRFRIPGCEAAPDSLEFKTALLGRSEQRDGLKTSIEKLNKEKNTLDMSLREYLPILESLAKILPECFSEDVEKIDPEKLEFEPAELHGLCTAHIRRSAEINDALSESRRILAAGLAAHEWTQEYFKKLCSLTDDEVHVLRDNIKAIQVALESAQRLLVESGKKLSEHRAKEEAQAQDDKTAAALKEEIEFRRERSRLISETIGGLNQQLQADAAARAERDRVLRDAGPLIESAARWKRLSDLLGDSEGKVLRGIAQSYVLGGLIAKANSYMKSLMPRYRLSGVSGTYEINVEDAYEGYTTRSARHISGGETFVVSLALALALADMGSGLRVDTLFIDEGFGNLSGEPLRAAVDTLRALRRNGGRRVGIISHIESLRDTIPVQIRVDQEPGSSCSRVTIG